MAENKSNAAKEAEILQKDESEILVKEKDDDFVEDQKLDCIYDDEPFWVRRSYGIYDKDEDPGSS